MVDKKDTGLVNAILEHIDKNNTLFSLKYAEDTNVSHNDLVSALKSLEAKNYLKLDKFEEDKFVLTSEGQSYVDKGTPEYRVFVHIPAEGMPMKQAQDDLGDLYKFGFQNAAKKKWLQIDKATSSIKKLKETVVDDEKELLEKIANGDFTGVDDKTKGLLKKRKLIEQKKISGFNVSKGESFQKEVVEKMADLSAEMIQKGTWKTLEFKPFNVNALGKEITAGNLHPLMKMRKEFREILLEMGFEEMTTNRFVESSFWNFDSLFQPQQHPARECHDTFFVSKPELCKVDNPEYWERVKTMHESGDSESIGWRYNWSTNEARKNIFRTHTTAVSSKMLYKMAQEGFRPMKLFSVDRVFRNETLDATHLAEFHQVEGSVCGKNLGLNHLKGIIREFFKKIGMTQLKFKPAYNPYTEPSMEIFAY